MSDLLGNHIVGFPMRRLMGSPFERLEIIHIENDWKNTLVNSFHRKQGH